jgi:ATP-dependent Clp protease ATP-binding subunit ClpB
VEAARRKFTPEFLNRLDKIVVFKPLGVAELRQVLDIELKMVQERILTAAATAPFVFTVSPAARDFLLVEGVDVKYGARHLKRAIERRVVQPLSNLVASGQVRAGDWVRVDFDPLLSRMTFLKEAEGMHPGAMAEVADVPPEVAASTHVAATESEVTRATRVGRRA